jgi:hypothetical protein
MEKDRVILTADARNAWEKLVAVGYRHRGGYMARDAGRSGRREGVCDNDPRAEALIKLLPLKLLGKLAALVPLPHVHLVRYAGCLAPHSTLPRAFVFPTR